MAEDLSRLRRRDRRQKTGGVRFARAQISRAAPRLYLRRACRSARRRNRFRLVFFLFGKNGFERGRQKISRRFAVRQRRKRPERRISVGRNYRKRHQQFVADFRLESDVEKFGISF